MRQAMITREGLSNLAEEFNMERVEVAATPGRSLASPLAAIGKVRRIAVARQVASLLFGTVFSHLMDMVVKTCDYFPLPCF